MPDEKIEPTASTHQEAPGLSDEAREKARQGEIGAILLAAGMGIMLLVAFFDGTEAAVLALGGPVFVAGIIQMIRHW